MNWIKFKFLYFAISSLILIPGIYSLLRFGLRLSIEFTGGSVVELSNVDLDQNQIKDKLAGFEVKDQQNVDSNLKLTLRPISQEQLKDITAALIVENKEPKVVSFQTVGPTLGKETLLKTLNAVAIASILILIYVAKIFKDFKYGFCAVLAMLHDSLVLLGIFSLLGHFLRIETDLLFVTAVLTTLSFSVHDTIVVYDRIRELSRKNPTVIFANIANRAITETMIRSLNNSLTIIFMLLALVLMGGSTIHNFALALLIGAITGTYSSPFTAVPLLVIIHNWKRRFPPGRWNESAPGE